MSKPVLILKSELFRMGGAEKIAFRLANAFLEKGVDTTLVTTGSSNVKSDFSIANFDYKSAMSFLKVQEYDRFCQNCVKQSHGANVFSFDRTSYQTHLRASNGVHAAYIAFRGRTEGLWKKLSFPINPLHRVILSLEKKAFESPTLQKLFTNSTFVKNQILHFYKVDPNRIEVVHNGVEWDEWAAPFKLWKAEKKEIGEQLGLDSDRFQFLFVGHNFKRKGLDLALKAMHHLSRKDFQLAVVGKDKDLHLYEALVKNYGLESNVRFFGPRTDILPFYQFADSLLIPSLYDPFANVTLEALAMGLFVVSSKNNGASEILQPFNGTVIEDLSDLDALTLSLEEALKHLKTLDSSKAIRDSTRRFDFSAQLKPFVDSCTC